MDLRPKYHQCVTFTFMISTFVPKIQSSNEREENTVILKSNVLNPIFFSEDKVLLKQIQNRDKMTPTFRPEPMPVEQINSGRKWG